jgi:hypothetical protein
MYSRLSATASNWLIATIGNLAKSENNGLKLYITSNAFYVQTHPLKQRVHDVSQRSSASTNNNVDMRKMLQT